MEKLIRFFSSEDDDLQMSLRAAVVLLALFLVDFAIASSDSGADRADATHAMLFILRLGEATCIAGGGILFVVYLSKGERTRMLAKVAGGMGILFLLLLCGFGNIYPIVPFTHSEIRASVVSVSSQPGVVVERIDPPMERATTFLVLEVENGQHYFVEAWNAPKMEELVVGTSIAILQERIGRFAFTKWLWGSEPELKQASEVRLVSG